MVVVCALDCCFPLSTVLFVVAVCACLVSIDCFCCCCWSHPTVEVAHFGSNVSGRLTSSREELRLVLITFCGCITILRLAHRNVGLV